MPSIPYIPTQASDLGATAVGAALFTLTNPSAVTFLRVNADNSVSALSASAFRTAIGAGTGNGDLLAANNLSDLSNVVTARTNLGLGSAALQASSAFDAAGLAASALASANAYADSSLAAFAGSANVVALGTVTTGVWHGTALGAAYLPALDGLTSPAGNLNLASHRIINLADPSAAQDAATKAYVDALTQGLDVKASVRAATAGNIALTGAQTIDGVSVVAGDRVLVKAQTAGADNGIYVAAAGTWARAGDADVSAEVTSGLFTFVAEGTVNGSTGWVLTTADPIVLGTTSLAFTQFSGAGTYTAGAGLTLTGTQFLVGTGQLTNAMLAGGITAAKLVGTDIATVGTITAGTWTGTVVAVTYGGTGAATLAANGVLYGNATSAIQALAVNATATNKFLTQSSSGAPAWNTIVAGDIATVAANSVSNSDGTLTISPTTGAVVASLALGHANTWTAAQTNSTAGAASTPSINITGSPYAAGTATTNFPLVYINESTATASTTLSTSGTYFGVNAHGSGDLMNLMQDGTRRVKVIGSAQTVANTGGGVTFPTGTLVTNCIAIDNANSGISLAFSNGAQITGNNGLTFTPGGNFSIGNGLVICNGNDLTGQENISGSPSTFIVRGGRNTVRSQNGNHLALKGGAVTSSSGGGNWNGGNIYISGGVPIGTGTNGNIYLGHDGTTPYGLIGVGFGSGTPSALLHVQSPSASTIGLISQAAASATASAFEAQNSSGTAYVTVGPPTLLGSSATSNWLNITGTLPTTLTAAVNAVSFQVTTAGSSSQNINGLYSKLIAGYTGSASTAALYFENAVAGTGTTGAIQTAANFGVVGWVHATTTGDNVAVSGYAEGGNINYGVIGNAIINKNSAKNIGVLGLALNTGSSPTQVGGYFGLQNATPTFASSALIADNGSTTSPIFLCRDNGTTTFGVNDGGTVTLRGITYTFPAADAAGALTSNGSGALSWAAAGGGSPGGSDTQVQYNNATAFGGATYSLIKSNRARFVAGTSTTDGGAFGGVQGYFTDANNTGTSETDLYTYTTPAGFLATNGDTVEVYYAGTTTTSGPNEQFRVYFGGTSIFDSGTVGLGGITAGNWTVYATLIQVSSTVVRCFVEFAGSGLTPQVAYTEVTGLTLSNTNVLKITGQTSGIGAGSNQITGKLGWVRHGAAA